MQGKLIVMEGIDGSGKSTQYARLCRRMEEEGVTFRHVSFPRYDRESSALLRQYLRGDFGARPGDVSAFAASAFFAVDRFASYTTDWKASYQAGGVILCDRYTTSNAVHQGAKLPPEELADFLDWLYDFEFTRMGLPAPDLVLYMDADVEASVAHLRSREAATGTQADIHEKDTAYLRACAGAGSFAADHLGWRRITCQRDGSFRDREEIHGEIWDIVRETLKD